LGIEPSNTLILYAGTYTGVYKSTDAGATWSISSQELDAYKLAIDPLNNSKVYAGTYEGVCYYHY